MLRLGLLASGHAAAAAAGVGGGGSGGVRLGDASAVALRDVSACRRCISGELDSGPTRTLKKSSQTVLWRTIEKRGKCEISRCCCSR